jgi:osmotically-inducible protein OsmY
VEALIAKSEASEDLISDVLPESGKELESLLNERLRTHPALSSAQISVRITPAQEILLSGEVHSEAERLLAVEITEAIAPALAVVADLHLPMQRRW